MKKAIRWLAISLGAQMSAGFLYIVGLIMGGFANTFLMLSLLLVAIILWLISIGFGIGFIVRVLWGKII